MSPGLPEIICPPDRNAMDCADESNGYVRAQSADTIKSSFRCVIYDCTIRNFLWTKIYDGAHDSITPS
jgi:hypothetical protein